MTVTEGLMDPRGYRDWIARDQHGLARGSRRRRYLATPHCDATADRTGKARDAVANLELAEAAARVALSHYIGGKLAGAKRSPCAG